MHGPQTGVCRACGELTNALSNATCLRCGYAFHLALRQDLVGKDCGMVWIDEESQTLDFACDVCLGRVTLPERVEPARTAGYTRSTGERASAVLRRKRAGRRRPS